MSYNKKAHLRANIDAIRIVLALDKEKRLATATEVQILQQYSGFGGLKCVLNPASTLADTASWAKSEIELFPLVSELHCILRENTSNEREYRNYMSSIQNSVLSAFYTPPQVIGSINNALQEKGIIIDRFLDPSAGIGAFSSQFKLADEAESICFEKDLLTGKILSSLHPENKIKIEGFERMESRYNNYFDVVASNIPFGEMKVFDAEYRTKKPNVYQDSTNYIHDYFFLKGLDSIREGGIVAFLTSQGVANSPKGLPIRTFLMSQADLVSLVRLPNNLFIDSAGTEVGSDLIILQKRTDKKIMSEQELSFVSTHKNKKEESVNNLFADNNLNRIVHTQEIEATDMYGRPSLVYLHEGGTEGIATDLQKMLSVDFSKNLNTELYHSHSFKPHVILSNSPTEEDRQEMATYFDEGDKRFFEQHPPTPEDFEEKKDKPKVEESLEINVSAPVMSLYDLWGFSEDERMQVKPKRGQRKAAAKVQPIQKDLFGNTVEERQKNQPQPKNVPVVPQEKTEKQTVYPVFDARKEETKRQWEEYMKPRPYSGVLKAYHKEGTLVREKNEQIGVLKKRYSDGAEFHPLDIPHLQKGKLEKYIEIRNSYHELYDFEAKNLTEDANLRKKLEKTVKLTP